MCDGGEGEEERGGGATHVHSSARTAAATHLLTDTSVHATDGPRLDAEPAATAATTAAAVGA